MAQYLKVYGSKRMRAGVRCSVTVNPGPKISMSAGCCRVVDGGTTKSLLMTFCNYTLVVLLQVVQLIKSSSKTMFGII